METIGAIERTVTVDLDKTPYVLVQTPPGSPSFDIKVNDRDHPVDIALKPTERLGAVAADVSAATGWHGVKTFHLLLYALGKGVPTTFTRVQFFGLPALPPPMPNENVWRPDEITDSATVGGAAGRIGQRRDDARPGQSSPSACTLARAARPRWC